MQPLSFVVSQEWLLTNGIGGFATGTVAGCATRRYHSLLTVALDPPSGRRMSLLGGLDEVVIADGIEYPLATHAYSNGILYPEGWKSVKSYGAGWWEYCVTPTVTLKKSIQLLPEGNALAVEYYCTTTSDVAQHLELRLAPLTCWTDSHATMTAWPGFPLQSDLTATGWCLKATDDAPALHFTILNGKWTRADWWNKDRFLAIEKQRGFDSTESLYCPATVTARLVLNRTLTFVASLDEPRRPSEFRATGRSRKKTAFWHATEQFIVHAPSGRTTILAGYPWFTDWGRDTFIALPGLCLTTGRLETAQQIIRDFVPWVRNGRIPNRFPDDGIEPAYNNVDGTLWFLHCIGLCGLKDELSETVAAIVGAHKAGTVGDWIHADDSGLLRCGDDHTNLTWMDAKVDGVVITPRCDRPVEVQALWINALRLAGETALAEKAAAAFLGRFVRADGLGLYDCLFPDGTPDASIRPNQVIAAAILDLPASVNAAILAVATEHLLTPYGLRTLSPTDPRFCPRYEGNYRQRDSAYHQGTVWPWLIGSFCDLYKKVNGPGADVTAFLSELERHFEEDYGLNGIAEIFDGAAPYRPDGCPWQAWSLAEVLRHH